MQLLEGCFSGLMNGSEYHSRVTPASGAVSASLAGAKPASVLFSHGLEYPRERRDACLRFGGKLADAHRQTGW